MNSAKFSFSLGWILKFSHIGVRNKVLFIKI